MQYPNIDIKQTGILLETMIRSAGYNVKYIQEYLHLSCPQPIYRWFKGKILPSLDHMYALSILLGVHMDELIVPQKQNILVRFIELSKDSTAKRCISYYYKFYQVA
jgi:hypothetical protein